VLKYLEEGGELEPLLIGKIAIRHVPIIKELQVRQVLKPMPLIPRYFEQPLAMERLKKLKQGRNVLNLI
jgi:hypothetical protein